MKKLTKIVSLILAAIFTVAVFAACADKGGEETGTIAEAVATTDPVEVTTESPYDDKGLLKDSIPEDLKLDRTITLLYWSDREHEEFIAEAQNGEMVNDAIFTRNTRVEERLGITFNYKTTEGNATAAHISNFVDTVRQGIKSGSMPYDMVAAHSFTIGSCAVNGLLSDIRNAEYLDFSKPWWPDSLIEDATIKGKLFFASGDISANTLYMMYVTFFNKSIIDNLGLELPFDLVDRNEWTIDKMFEMCNDTYVDTDTNGNATIGDFYGQYAYTLHLDVFFTGAGIKILDVSNDTIKISDDFIGTKAVDIADKVTNFFHNNSKAYLLTENSDVAQWFAKELSIFWNDRCRNATKFKENEVAFGVVPNPKYDKNQDEYYTVLGNPFSLYAIPNDCTEVDLVSAVMECYASESYRNVSPALYDTTIKYRYTDDAISSAMFDTIRESVIFDLGRIFASALGSPYGLYENCIKNKTSWAVSATGQMKQVWPKAIKEILSAFN
ncbi:MAG: hypothetical protein ILO42_00505 [Clostridia bacterium]|nr:hypothetical protein [Clostridia bacterium]